MRASKFSPAISPFLLAVALAVPAVAQDPQVPWVAMETTAVNVGIGGQSGEGLLHLPNLGTNCAYPFKVSGFGAGIHVGVSKAVASGYVSNLTRISDLSGQYSATQGDATLLAGAGALQMKNRRNNVGIEMKSETQGISLGFGGQGMTIAVAEPPAGNAPRSYVLTFGYNKTWVNQESRAMLDQVVRAWKCRYANIWLFGHTDTVGKEDVNLELSQERANAVREYLIGAGVVPTRVLTKPRGEDRQLAVTDENVRLRTNRAVVVVIQE